jgi:hypothetical protein
MRQPQAEAHALACATLHAVQGSLLLLGGEEAAARTERAQAEDAAEAARSGGAPRQEPSAVQTALATNQLGGALLDVGSILAALDAGRHDARGRRELRAERRQVVQVLRRRARNALGTATH